MNVFTGYGRLTNDVTIQETKGGTKTAKFTLAISRTYKDANGNYSSDFIQCVTFNEHLVKMLPQFVGKGDRLTINGSLQIQNFKNDDGTYNNFTNVIVNSVSWVESKAEREQGGNNQAPQQKQAASYQPTKDDLPF